MTIVELKVRMDCPGCKRKLRKALQNLDGLFKGNPRKEHIGVNGIDIVMSMQKVTVTGWVDRNEVLKTVRETGRKAELWSRPYNPQYHNFTHICYNQQHNQSRPKTYYTSDQPSSSYIYYVHGYNGHDLGNYYHQPPSSTIVDELTSTMFSDENPNACSIM